MKVDDIAEKVIDPLVGGADDITALARALVLVAARRGFMLEVDGLTAVVRVRHAEQPGAHAGTVLSNEAKLKVLEDNDARVGRRLTSYGKRGFR